MRYDANICNSVSTKSSGLRSTLLVACCVWPFYASAIAQDTNVEVSGEITAVAGSVDGDFEADADARVKVKTSRVLDSGLEIGGVFEARADGDIPQQYWAGGRYSGLLSGGSRGVGPLEGDAFLQSAFAYLKGGFGEISIGRDNGIASQLAVTSPTVFRAIGVNDWKSDLSNLNDIQTVNDFSGYSTKLTYMPPANFLGGIIGGLQVGVSYSPELKECEEELCAPVTGSVPAAAGQTLVRNSSWRDVVETALYFERGIGNPENDIRLGLGASYVTASEDVGNTPPGFDDYESYAVGLNVAIKGFTLGGSIKNTNAGLDVPDDDAYLAFDAGITYETGPWGFMLGYGSSDAARDAASPLDPSFFRETELAQAGVSYVFQQGVTLGAAAQFVDSDKPDSLGGQEEKASIIFESSIKF
ncbi:MAG: porin [Aquisalinus sp.]|nr:porin [Aquisalinus sp.]